MKSMNSHRCHGVYAPVLTPFDANLAPDAQLFINHCRWLVARGLGLAIFGTNSEAASLSVQERLDLTDALLEAGIPPNRLMPGTGACSITDAITLTRHAVNAEVGGTLMLPPFFYTNTSDEGLFGYFSEIVERIGSDRLKIYLYHIPQYTQVPITLRLIEMLRKQYPQTVVGAKDSSGDWANTKAMIDNFAKDGFSVFPASESTLSKALPLGAAGCISATANVNPAGIQALYENWSRATGLELQANADAIRQIFQAAPMIPAMKCVAGEFSGMDAWTRVRPPLERLSESVKTGLLASLQEAGFKMPGFSEAMALKH